MDKTKMAYMLARAIMKHRDTIDGITVMQGGGLMSTSELCQVGREALRLIEERIVT